MFGRLILGACCAMLLALGARGAPLGKEIEWQGFDAHAESFRVGGLTITFKRTGKAYDETFTVKVRDARGGAFVFKGQGGQDGVALASFAVLKLDAATPGNQVVIDTYSGGPHCCAIDTIIEHTRDGWKAIALPAGREAGAAGSQVNDTLAPKDIDGDGYPDFVLSDDRFDYTFASYTGSWLPPRIFRLQAGAFVDESASRKFDAVFRKDMKEVKPGCLEKTDSPDGSCAGYVADAARIGQFESGWRFMLAHYSKEDVQAECTVPVSEGHPCPERATIWRTFPDRLAHFLGENGYITSDQVTWALSTVRK
jgi:hypothetical protein